MRRERLTVQEAKRQAADYPFLLLYGVLRLLPLKCGYTLVAPLISLLFLVDRRHARRSVQHILHAGITDDRAEARRLARRSYREFGKLLEKLNEYEDMTPEEIQEVARLQGEYAAKAFKEQAGKAMEKAGAALDGFMQGITGDEEE